MKSWVAIAQRGVSSPWFAGLCIVASICAARWTLEMPNFKPVGALALLAGWVGSRSRGLWLAPLVGLALSDLWLGSYEWPVMLAVYGATLANVVGGRWLATRRLALSKSPLQQTALVWGGSLAASWFFFVVTNLAVWLGSGWYPRDLAGGLSCFLNAWPFFKWTAAADLVFFALPMTVWIWAQPSWVATRNLALALRGKPLREQVRR